MTYANETCHMYERVMSHTRMSHESCLWQWVMSQVCDMTHLRISLLYLLCTESWVMSVTMSHESCLWHDSFAYHSTVSTVSTVHWVMSHVCDNESWVMSVTWHLRITLLCLLCLLCSVLVDTADWYANESCHRLDSLDTADWVYCVCCVYCALY